jgi:DNA-binding MarR family transcriptional regulator
MRILLQGQLEEGILGNLLQYLTLNQVSGVLQLRNARNRVGEIFFNNGQIVHIEVGKLQGVPALAALESWSSGGFNFRTQVAAPQHSVQLSLNNLLLEVNKFRDSQPPDDFGDVVEDTQITADTVLTPVINNQNQGTVELRLQALHLFMQIDGARSLGDIAGRLGIPIDSVIDVAEELIDQDYVEFASSPAVSGDFVSGLSQLVTDFMEAIDEETTQPPPEPETPAPAPQKQAATSLGADSILTLLPVVQNQGTVELRPETLDFLTQIDISGPRPLADVARDMNKNIADVVSLAENLMSQGLVELADSPTVSQDFITELTRLFGNFMGPLARIFLEDAFESLDVEADSMPQASVPDVLRTLRGQLERDIQKTAFDRQVKRLCEKYGLGEQVEAYLQQTYAKNTTQF